MSTSRFPCLINPPRRAYSKFLPSPASKNFASEFKRANNFKPSPPQPRKRFGPGSKGPSTTNTTTTTEVPTLEKATTPKGLPQETSVQKYTASTSKKHAWFQSKNTNTNTIYTASTNLPIKTLTLKEAITQKNKTYLKPYPDSAQKKVDYKHKNAGSPSTAATKLHTEKFSPRGSHEQPRATENYADHTDTETLDLDKSSFKSLRKNSPGKLYFRPLRESLCGNPGLREYNSGKPDFKPREENTTYATTRRILEKDPILKVTTLSEPLEPPGKAPLQPSPLPVFKQSYLGINCEERDIGYRNPIGVRIYHPHPTSSSVGAKILYLPSNTTTFFPPSEEVISVLSKITSATIIIPTPTTTVEPFPRPVDDFLRIHDHFRSESATHAPTVILAAGMAAAIATSVAVTEPSITALGVWGGVLDLTVHSEQATAWNRRLQQWDHFPENPPIPVPNRKRKLGMTIEEFIALRRHYFPKPETWPDPFASPQLFFRSAGVEFSRQTMKEIFGDRAKELLALSNPTLQIDWEGNHVFPRRQPRVWQQFPPQDREGSFPKMRIVLPVVGERDDVTAEQGMEFASSVKECLIGWLTSKSQDREDARIDANMMITFERLEEEDTWVDEVEAMARWFKWTFDGSPPIHTNTGPYKKKTSLRWK